MVQHNILWSNFTIKLSELLYQIVISESCWDNNHYCVTYLKFTKWQLFSLESQNGPECYLVQKIVLSSSVLSLAKSHNSNYCLSLNQDLQSESCDSVNLYRKIRPLVKILINPFLRLWITSMTKNCHQESFKMSMVILK